ncbi:MAG: glycosyltransferase, partial [Sphingobacteriales bacterium]
RRLAIVTTHPIQYYAPVFRLLAERKNIEIKVFYTWGQSALTKHDPGFGKQVTWDLPLLDGYPYEFVENVAPQPGSHHFKGIDNPGLNKTVTAWQPDAVLVYGWAYRSHLKAIRFFKKKVPVYFRGDSTLLDQQHGFKSLLRSIALKWVYSHIDIAFYPGSNTKAYFQQYGLKPHQLIFAPHAVDNARFASERTGEAAQLRHQLVIGNEEIMVLFAGKFESKKDPLLLVDAFLQLKQAGCHLVMVGNGVLETVLKSKAAGAANIHFMDFQNQSYMPVVYQACDLFCLPSKGPNETWGLAVNEAMACGKAILVSDKVGCAADLVQPNKNGLIFKAGDADSLLDALKKLTSVKGQLKQFGKASADAIQHWNFCKFAEAVELAINTAKRTDG